MKQIQYTDSNEIDAPLMYRGEYLDVVPKLREEDQSLMSSRDIIEQIVNYAQNAGGLDKLALAWEKSYKEEDLEECMRNPFVDPRYDFKGGEFFVQDPDGKYKLLQDSRELGTIDSESMLGQSSGCLLLPNGTFDRISGQEFSKPIYEDKGKDSRLTIEDALNDPLTLAIVQEDKALLKEFLELMKNERNLFFERTSPTMYKLSPPSDRILSVSSGSTNGDFEIAYPCSISTSLLGPSLYGSALNKESNFMVSKN